MESCSRHRFFGAEVRDVKVSNRQVRLHLPARSVQRALDSAKTRVYSRQTGLLVPTVQIWKTQVRQEAEKELQESALAEGVLRTAQQNATSLSLAFCKVWDSKRIEFE